VKVVEVEAEPEPDVEPDAEPDVGFNGTGNPPVAGFGTYNGLVPWVDVLVAETVDVLVAGTVDPVPV
jgi:hypothetical protein